MKFFIFILLLILNNNNLIAQRRPQSDPFDITNQVDDQSELKPNESVDEKIKKNFFLKADISKTTSYVGEGLMATFKLYSRLNANSRVVKRPSLTGFSVVEMVDAYNNDPDIEEIGGKAFYVHLIRKVQLFPLQAGTFDIDPAEVESEIYFLKHAQKGKGRKRIADFFLNREYEGPDSSIVKKISLETPRTEIIVNQLPEDGQPEDFSGAVGNFAIDLKMNNKTLNQYDPADVKLLIMGTGNFPLVTDPVIVWPKGVVVSQPQVTEDLNKYVFPLSGVKVFQYSLETRDAGTYTIPPVTFSFFDPLAKKYKTTETSSITYTVSPGKKKSNSIVEKIIAKPGEFPIQYVYFAVILLVIIGVIFFQVVSKKSNKK
ncbi:MAG: BatD family protein [Flavitalea sp.]